MLTAAALLVLALTAGQWTTEPVSVEPTTKCSLPLLNAGLCDGNDDDSLDLEEFRPGNPGTPGNPGVPGPQQPPAPPPAPNNPDPGYPPAPGGPGSPQLPADPNSPPAPDNGGWQCMDADGGALGNSCVDDLAPDPEEPTQPEAPAAPVVPDIPPEIDERDVASFAPQATTPTIEPFGVAIMNAPMNVAFDVSSHAVDGSLFELPVTVTFTPDIVTIDYGDGTQTQVSGSAATWDGLGQQQLTPTATSHTYGERGVVTVRVDVAYSATVDFGQWGVYPVSGHILTRGAGTEVQVYEKQSYLVERTCEEDPQGPGC